MLQFATFNLRANFNQHPLTELPGVGRHTSKALKLYGINTVEQFALFTENEITALLGNSGKKLLTKAKRLINA